MCSFKWLFIFNLIPQSLHSPIMYFLYLNWSNSLIPYELWVVFKCFFMWLFLLNSIPPASHFHLCPALGVKCNHFWQSWWYPPPHSNVYTAKFIDRYANFCPKYIILLYSKSKHLKACLGPASVTFLHRRGPPLALRPLQFCTGGGHLWHSVRCSFAPEGAPLALRPVWFCTGGGPLGTLFVTVLALCPSRFSTGGGPLGTPSVTVLHPRGPPWHSVCYGFAPEMLRLVFKEGVRSVPMRTVPSRRST